MFFLFMPTIFFFYIPTILVHKVGKNLKIGICIFRQRMGVRNGKSFFLDQVFKKKNIIFK